MKKLIIIIPTYNRPLEIEAYLRQIYKALNKFNVDLLICDSSNNKDTKEFFDQYHCKSEHIYYKKYPDNINYDTKVRNIFNYGIEKYDYAWLCGDGCIINLDDAILSISTFINQKIDVIHLDNLDPFALKTKEYVICQKFFKECFWRITLYGSTIISNHLYRIFKSDNIANKYEGSGFLYQCSLMEYCASHNFSAVHLVCDYYKKNPYKQMSTWRSKTLWQWGKSWYESIIKLPDVYNDEKEYVIRSHDKIIHIFSIKELLDLRMNNNLQRNDIKRYKKYLKKCTNTNIIIFYFISYIPPLVIRKIRNLVKK